MKKNKYGIISIIIIIFILLTSFSSILNFITNLKWFNEIEYVKSFLTKIKSELIIGIPLFFVLMLVFFFFTKRLFKRSNENESIAKITANKKRTNKYILLGSAILSFFFTIMLTSNLWLEILQFFNSTAFNLKDPIFDKDLSFYVFKLPLFNTILKSLIEILILMIAATIIFNLIVRAGRKFKNVAEEFSSFGGNKNINISQLADKGTLQVILNQISILGFILIILVGIKIYLSTYNLLYSPTGVVFGAGYTDIAITLNVYRIMSVLCFVAAFTFLIGSRKKNLKLSLIIPVCIIALSILGNIAGFVVEKFIVEPDQFSKESKYISNNITFTQYAYGLNNVKQIDFEVNDKLTKEDIVNNEEVIENIRINDATPLNQVYNKLQGIRPYYTFNDVDIDRYYIDGKYQQVYLSARELDQNLLNSQARTWINQYLKYTHGYGVALSHVNEVTTQGQPKMVLKDIPPVTNTNLVISRPEIYFGEKTNDYIIVNTDEKEFDYPSGSDNVETKYEGTAGINLSFMNRVLFAMKEGNYKLLISNNISSDSKIIKNRNVIDRVQQIAPFLTYDSDPYIIINQENGKLYWIIDAFTVSDRYPYSLPIKDSKINYLRNSVKVVIDAYNGTTDFYIVDENDPIVMTYDKIFDGLFKPLSDMDDGIRQHIRYSTQMLDIQSQMYRTYHMENPTVFLSKEDVWDISKQKYMSEEQVVKPNYYMFKLPEEDSLEFLLTIPYTPSTKDNMSAMLVARNDGENYGELILYKFTKNKTIQGTALIESKIDQNTEISSQLTLWSQKGSNVLRGNTLVIPVGNSLLYVEPIYMQSDTQSNFPEMKMVIVAHDDNIVMEPTLEKALSKLLGDVYSNNIEDQKDIDDNEISPTGTVEELIQQSNSLFKEAQEALKSGNWSLYGEKIELLEEKLKKLNSMVNANSTDESNVTQQDSIDNDTTNNKVDENNTENTDNGSDS